VKRALEYSDPSEEPSLKKQKVDSNFETPSKKSESNYDEEASNEAHTNSSQNPGQATDSHSNSYDYYAYANVFFATEKINLPRGKVVEEDSVHSSPSHGFRNGQDDDFDVGSRQSCLTKEAMAFRPGTISP
jgi:hypothetical protein